MAPWRLTLFTKVIFFKLLPPSKHRLSNIGTALVFWLNILFKNYPPFWSISLTLESTLIHLKARKLNITLIQVIWMTSIGLLFKFLNLALRYFEVFKKNLYKNIFKMSVLEKKGGSKRRFYIKYSLKHLMGSFTVATLYTTAFPFWLLFVLMNID